VVQQLLPLVCLAEACPGGLGAGSDHAIVCRQCGDSSVMQCSSGMLCRAVQHLLWVFRQILPRQIDVPSNKAMGKQQRLAAAPTPLHEHPQQQQHHSASGAPNGLGP
jgi:hypothetical protein